MKIYIYGTGPSAVSYYETLDKGQFELIGFLDSDLAKEGGLFYNLPIYHLDTLPIDAYDEIHIASSHLEIVDFLLVRGIAKEKIVLADYTLEIEYIKTLELLGGIRMNSEYVLTSRMAYKNNREIEKQFYWSDIFGEEKTNVSYDYCRCKTAQLLSEEVIKNGVEGDLAELGVAQGDFSKLLNCLFPNRRLDLFDTFDGFDAREKAFELAQGYTQEKFFSTVGDFKELSEAVVLNKMVNPEQCRIFKGKFPDTVRDMEEIQYALVSIDCDLYVPVLEGLKYFYPRLSEGGYIMLHDYNHVHFLGIKEAVRECEKIFGRIHKVPIADQGGSLVISK